MNACVNIISENAPFPEGMGVHVPSATRVNNSHHRTKKLPIIYALRLQLTIRLALLTAKLVC